MVTVALDLEPERAARYIGRAKPSHPSLVDQAHRMDELFGVVNVPSGLWIDEEGMIVRPPEPAFPEGSVNTLQEYPPLPEGLPPYTEATLREARKIRTEPGRYVAALRDWVSLGRGSEFALTPEEVVAQSRPRPPEAGLAAAHFELAQHLQRSGDGDGAVGHFRAAHRLQPENWTYKRQAWSLQRRDQGPTDVYDGDWVSDVLKIGPENYYEPLQM